jgi:hypothetical protein
MGHLITYAGCPMHWASKMQTEIALSTTEEEYIALSQSMREVLPITWLLEEAKQHGIPILNTKPKVGQGHNISTSSTITLEKK